ncbi:MAG: tetratricopeptide repeat-containing sulfotransferase family protein [Gammaproteobacteria bacterium]
MEHATRLLEAEPALAAEQAREILKVVPNHAPAAYLLARALARAGRGDEAIAALRNTVALKPDHPEAWRQLADHLLAVGDASGAAAAYNSHVKAATTNPDLQRAAVAMLRNDVPAAEKLLKAYLKEAPTDVAAIRMLAEVAARCDRDGDARKLLERCLELAPGFAAARYNYAILLHRTNDAGRALAEVERLLAVEPRNPSYRNLHAVVLSRIGEYARSSKIYAELLAEYPNNSKAWLSYGHVLKTEGRTDECIAAYRKSIVREPSFGEPYWSLANLKTFRFEEADFAAMNGRLGEANLTDADRVHFHFALGKAYEDARDYRNSFEHYARANALHHAGLRYQADLNTQRMKRMKATFAREFFREREGSGCQSPEPIFIVGMPRAGSTLLEQILSSHSAVEGTAELPEIIGLARGLRTLGETEAIGSYIEVLAATDGPALRELGERYLEGTRIHRKTGRPFFIDKMPNNFLHIGMIQLALPRAKIIDARRHPVACCFSNFKQHYARGQRFSYDLSDMSRYYRDYVELMAHFDEVLPGRIHRVFYERMVEDTEAEIRRLLDYCGLPFEESCLRFFENERPVQTASSEQVRQPIYREGMDYWRHFDEWLGPLKEALGPILDVYPGVPRFD